MACEMRRGSALGFACAQTMEGWREENATRSSRREGEESEKKLGEVADGSGGGGGASCEGL